MERSSLGPILLV